MGCHQPARMGDMEEEFPLLHDLRMTYLTSGGCQDDWDDLVHGLHHPQWALDWLDSSSPSHAKRLEDLAPISLAAGNLIEYEVRESESGVVTGVAVAVIQVFRSSRSQISLEVKHIASTANDYSDWASYHINEAGEFHLHLCKKPAGSCGASPASKKLGWVHVSKFRMTTFIKCLSPEYNADLILDALRARVETLIGAFGDKGPGVELRPREDEDFCDESDEEERRGRAVLKSQSARPVDAKVALGAAAPKSGDNRRKKVAEPHEDPRKRTKRGDTAFEGGAKVDEARKAQVAATKALMGGHPQMVLVEARQKKVGDAPTKAVQPWLDHLCVGDEDGSRQQPSRPQPYGRSSRKPPGGGGGGDDDDDDDGDGGDRGGRDGRGKRKSSDDEKKKKKRRKRKRSESDGENPPKGSGRASHIYSPWRTRRRSVKVGLVETLIHPLVRMARSVGIRNPESRRRRRRGIKRREGSRSLVRFRLDPVVRLTAKRSSTGRTPLGMSLWLRRQGKSLVCC